MDFTWYNIRWDHSYVALYRHPPAVNVLVFIVFQVHNFLCRWHELECLGVGQSGGGAHLGKGNLTWHYWPPNNPISSIHLTKLLWKTENLSIFLSDARPWWITGIFGMFLCLTCPVFNSMNTLYDEFVSQLCLCLCLVGACFLGSVSQHTLHPGLRWVDWLIEFIA